MKFPPELFSRLGVELKVTRDGKVKTYKAFLQSLRRKSHSYNIPKRHLSGLFADDHYLLIAPPDAEIINDDIIECGGGEYVVLSTDCYKIKKTKLYVWAVLTARTEQTEDDFDD